MTRRLEALEAAAAYVKDRRRLLARALRLVRKLRAQIAETERLELLLLVTTEREADEKERQESHVIGEAVDEVMERQYGRRCEGC